MPNSGHINVRWFLGCSHINRLFILINQTFSLIFMRKFSLQVFHFCLIIFDSKKSVRLKRKKLVSCFILCTNINCQEVEGKFSSFPRKKTVNEEEIFKICVARFHQSLGEFNGRLINSVYKSFNFINQSN